MLSTKWRLRVSSAWLLVGRGPTNKYRVWWRKNNDLSAIISSLRVLPSSHHHKLKRNPQECTERGSKTQNLHSFHGRFGLWGHELKNHASIRIHMDGGLANEAGTRSNSWHMGQTVCLPPWKPSRLTQGRFIVAVPWILYEICLVLGKPPKNRELDGTFLRWETFSQDASAKWRF